VDCIKQDWHNWEESYKCVADVCIANTVDELRAVIQRAKDEGRTIRMSAGGRGNDYSASFSGSPVVTNEGDIIVMTPELNQAWPLLDGSNRVKAQAGMTLKELDVVLQQNRLTLDTETAPNFLTVAGAVALSCHGCGRHGGTMSDSVVGMTILDHRGELHTIGEDKPELLRAAQVNLGCLGIVIDVTFQCLPQFKLLATDRVDMSIDEALDRVGELFFGHDYLEYFWYPYNDRVWVKYWDRVPYDTPDVNAPGKYEDLKQRFIGFSSDLILRWATAVPRLTPLCTKVLMAASAKGTMVALPYDVFHYQNYFPKSLYDLSYAIDNGDDFSRFRSAFQIIREKVLKFSKPKGSPTSASPFAYGPGAIFPQNFIVHCRFIKNSNGYMAPAVDNGHTTMFEAITYFGADCEAYYREIEDHWLSLGGRPHWGKTYRPTLDFRALYGRNWDAFDRIRRQMDPDGLFLNDFMRHVFQVKSRQTAAA
jgi:L-gulonolactone oxidase